MDVARIRLRSNGYDVFNAIVTANINGSLFQIKMVEEWCGPLQWIENVKVANVVDYSSGSDDGDDDGPPLFTAEGGWNNNSEDEWRDEEYLEEEEVVKHREGGEHEVEVESVVQETLEVLNDGIHEQNDWVDGTIKHMVIENEKNNKKLMVILLLMWKKLKKWRLKSLFLLTSVTQ